MADETQTKEPLSDGDQGTSRMTALDIGVIAGAVSLFLLIVLSIFLSRHRNQRAGVRNALRRAEGGAGRTEAPPRQQDQGLEPQWRVPGDRRSNTRRYWWGSQASKEESQEALALSNVPNDQSQHAPKHEGKQLGGTEL
ncbi:hypothetical protein G7Z17_g13058 [Cylindrodendrum hubeiense]|uniref:Uncharacterized protein n=1 Tax=Cylindrodendrum hubeiense TaxID=595255 RepID=A0A9P5L8M4_9HYPO|nr:hypothetical protein G7Z17_g13058 [Cylindrodendrum hubeiense]